MVSPSSSMTSVASMDRRFLSNAARAATRVTRHPAYAATTLTADGPSEGFVSYSGPSPAAAMRSPST